MKCKIFGSVANAMLNLSLTLKAKSLFRYKYKAKIFLNFAGGYFESAKIKFLDHP